MTEYRFVTFRQPATKMIPAQAGGVNSMTVDFANSIPELASQMDGWEVVNFQFSGVDGGDVVLMFLLRTKVSVPDGL